PPRRSFAQHAPLLPARHRAGFVRRLSLDEAMGTPRRAPPDQSRALRQRGSCQRCLATAGWEEKTEELRRLVVCCLPKIQEAQMPHNLSKLRTVIQESLRVERGSAEQVAYIDTGNVLSDVSARQNHVIFARRGCGKTLLLRYSGRHLAEG